MGLRGKVLDEHLHLAARLVPVLLVPAAVDDVPVEWSRVRVRAGVRIRVRVRVRDRVRVRGSR